MKRKIFIFILFIVGLTAYASKLINAISSHNPDANGVAQYEIIISSANDSDSFTNCDNTFDNPVSSIIFAYCNNIHSGHVRTISRCMRSMSGYNQIAFSKNGKILDFTLSHYLQSSHNVFCSAKSYGNHGFIRLHKLLI